MPIRTERHLICDDCGNEFLFTAAEQEDYARSPSFPQPRRCIACLRLRTAEQAGVRSRVAVRLPGSTPVRQAVECRGCGREVRISFAPRRGRPVFCQTCFTLGRRGPDTWERPGSGPVSAFDYQPAAPPVR